MNNLEVRMYYALLLAILSPRYTVSKALNCMKVMEPLDIKNTALAPTRTVH